jgi:hypothetical protein
MRITFGSQAAIKITDVIIPGRRIRAVSDGDLNDFIRGIIARFALS